MGQNDGQQGSTLLINGAVPATQISQGAFPQMPPIRSGEKATLTAKVLSRAFKFLEESQLCENSCRLNALACRLTLGKDVSEAELRSLEDQLRAIISQNLSKQDIIELPSRCKSLAEQTDGDPWAIAAAIRLSKKIDKYLGRTPNHQSFQIPVSSETKTMDILDALKFAVIASAKFQEICRVSLYKGPKFRKKSTKLEKAKKIIDYISTTEGPLNARISNIAKKLEMPQDRVKQTLKALAYASFGTIYDKAGATFGAEGVVDFRRVPTSLRSDIRRFRYALITDPVLSKPNWKKKCRKVTAELIVCPTQEDYDELLQSYSPLKGEEVEKTIHRMLYFYMMKTVHEKAASMGAHPVKAVAWFHDYKRRIADWEDKCIRKANAEKIQGLKKAQLEYDYLYAQSMFHFAKQVSELRDFVRKYSDGLDSEFMGLVSQLLGKDPMSGRDIVPQPERLATYLRGLEKTLDRWNMLGREFRTPPERLLRAMRASTEPHPEDPQITAIEAELARSMIRMDAVGEDNTLLLKAIEETKRDVLERMESISKHTKAAKKLYALAMKTREDRLGDVLPTKRMLRIAQASAVAPT